MVQDVCVIRSNRFLHHDCPSYTHPENPNRIKGLLTSFGQDDALRAIPSLPLVEASIEWLERIHTKELIEEIKASQGSAGWLDPDTYFDPTSAETALLAAGSSVQLALDIWNKKFRRGFAVVRPPGHHATHERAMGFCLFNNIALAVSAVLKEAPQAKIAIVDFDLHHGNGTQASFYNNPNVLFISSHRFPFYPGTGSLPERGEGKGKGTTVNFPLGRAFGDELFFPLYTEMVIPMVLKFRPDMLFVSAGYDGHLTDPMAGFEMTSSLFGRFNELLIGAAEKACDGKIAFYLEGGYNPTAVEESVLLATKAMCDLPREVFPLPEAKGKDLPELEAFRGHFKGELLK